MHEGGPDGSELTLLYQATCVCFRTNSAVMIVYISIDIEEARRGDKSDSLRKALARTSGLISPQQLPVAGGILSSSLSKSEANAAVSLPPGRGGLSGEPPLPLLPFLYLTSTPFVTSTLSLFFLSEQHLKNSTNRRKIMQTAVMRSHVCCLVFCVWAWIQKAGPSYLWKSSIPEGSDVFVGTTRVQWLFVG